MREPRSVLAEFGVEVGRDVELRVHDSTSEQRYRRTVLTEGLTWSTWREACQVVVHRAHLVRTIRIALIVGTLLFAINQLDVVVRGAATSGTYLKVALTYLVPFGVSNYGILIATRRRADQDSRPTSRPPSSG